jgi:hypothetical protein
MPDGQARIKWTNAAVESITEGIKNPDIGGWYDETCEDWTLITLSSFKAKAGHRSVKLTWETESEVDNAGFNLYRADSADGAYTKVNDALIPARGSPTEGAKYKLVDKGLKNGTKYFYKLEDIDLNGTSTSHGPENATPRLIKAFLP